MEEREALRLYATALAMLPDETTAAELFMRSQNEQELRSAANRWRRGQGLPELEMVTHLPSLDPNQQELALHLARRGQRRRMTRRALAGLAGALLLVAAALLPTRLPAEPSGLAADEAFRQPALARSAERMGLRLSVYRAEAYPGAVTVWWELKGPGASSYLELIHDSLLLLTDDEFSAGSIELQAHRRDRLLGRSVYPVLNTPKAVRLLLRAEAGEHHLAAEFQPHLLEEDPEAVSYELNETLDPEGFAIELKRLHVGKHATTISVRFSSLEQIRMPYLLADGKALTRTGIWEATRQPLEYDLVLESPPPGTRQLQIGFPLDAWRLEETFREARDPDFFRQWKVEDGYLKAEFLIEVEELYNFGVRLVSRESHHIPVLIRPDFSTPYLWVLESPLIASVPGDGDAELVQLSEEDILGLILFVRVPVPDPTVTLDL